VNRSQFLQVKSDFHSKHPELDDLAFARTFVRQYPEAAIGWFHLGKEWEWRGQEEQALSAYQQALHAGPGDFFAEAREAYQRLLRKRRYRRLSGALRRAVSVALLFSLMLFSPGALQDLPNRPALPTVGTVKPPVQNYRNHVEVIAVPEHLQEEQLRAQIIAYLKARRPSLTQPYTIIAVPERKDLPLFTPLLFYKPVQAKAILRYDPVSQSFFSQKWFTPACDCGQDPVVQKARTALTEEQRTLEQVLTLRNALYRHYQRNGHLPTSLSELASSYPANHLPAIPQPLTNEDGGPAWRYNPAAFRPEQAWESMREVVPLAMYPEPFIPLEPLQIRIHQASFSLLLISGSHPVRRYPIGIGKNGLTPEGYFFIKQKISRPRGHNNIYGTRGLIFAEGGYAIHGTNTPKSIGQAESLGCIRLRNADVEELYSFVSTGTEVIVSDREEPFASWSNPSPFLLPAGVEEETPGVIYHWLH
jgi:lipoprotein-anchoring transpeptidase ErfK/SrfK